MKGEPLIETRGLYRRYGGVVAVDRVSFSIAEGSIVALVGPSGSGKSTLARMLVRLEEPDGGEIRFEGGDVLRLKGPALLGFRERVQLVFQDAAATLNPRMPAQEIVAEPLEIRSQGTKIERRRRAIDLMEQVGIRARDAGRFPDEFSGGQRQRLALARALALRPRLLILDEALSGLDLSVRAQIVNLLADLQEARGLTYLHITHDLALAERMADRIAVMDHGRVSERGAA